MAYMPEAIAMKLYKFSRYWSSFAKVLMQKTELIVHILVMKNDGEKIDYYPFICNAW